RKSNPGLRNDKRSPRSGPQLARIPLRLTNNRSLTVTHGQPLLAYLFKVRGQRRLVVKKLLKRGAVRVNGDAVRQFDRMLSPGDKVSIESLQAASAIGDLEQAGIRLVYEDDALILVDKPCGLL